jgi:ABC-type antimicrobial peptide transport system permease subunit
MVALAAALVRFGPAALEALRWQQVGISQAVAVITGCVLSLVGVLYPAILAARMQPVEAMRVEQ